MTKQIPLEETLAIASNIPLEVPSRIADKIIQKATVDSVQNIGGFPVTDTLLAQDRLADAKTHRRMAIDQFNVDKEKLKAKMATLGIENYLAIVPTKYWKNLCDRHHLITVSPNLNGRVQVNTKVPYDLTEKAKHFWDIVASTIAVIAGLFAIVSVFIFFDALSIGTRWDTVFTTASCCVAFGFLAWMASHIGVRRGQTAILRHLKNTSYADLIRELLTPTRDYRWSDSSVQLELPAPPMSIVMLLRKLRDYKESFSVTADPNALSLNPSVETLYIDGHDIEVWRQAQERLDPIITLSHNNATLVLAQFGDFKWELDVIEDIMSSVSLPTGPSDRHFF